MIKKTLFQSFLLTFLFSCASEKSSHIKIEPESLGISTEKLNKLIGKVNELVDNGKIPCVQTALLKNGKLVSFHTYGYSDVESKKVLEDNSIFRIYSMTKPVVSIGLMMLYEKGVFELNDNVSKYLPQFGDDRRSITLRNILNMDGGLEYPEDQHEKMFLYNDQLKYALSVPLEKKPGSIWEYNNVNSMLLGAILESATGISADVLLEERILEPLGINNATLWKDQSENVMAYCCIDLTARDFSRFGLLFAQNGVWKGEQLIPADFIEETFSPAWKFSSPVTWGYSLHWWLAADDPESEIYYASGKFGQYIFVDRRNNLVVTKITKYDPTGGSIQNFREYQWLKEIDDLDTLLAVWNFLEEEKIMRLGEGFVTTPITREDGEEKSFRKNLYKFIDILKNL